MKINIDENTRLELTAQQHAEGLFNAVDKNRAHLSEFLPWVGHMQSVANFSDYIRYCETLYEQGQEVSFVIISDEIPVGRIGLHHINAQNKCAAIGYWLAKSAEGKGIITKSCKALISYGFKEVGLQRIEIKAATGNLKSQAIPKKLNFTREGVLRQAELVNGQFLDLVLYAMLNEEWEQALLSFEG
ncbi:GNAT family N-acetyltransferase [Pedobacter steynii]|uniref:GNAT family N-acetyltransferase n=1 Tax=Pedobacter steynii TaxID=430522 RepID=A0A1D7QLS6_9SPHI|nr:GNAT family protein [Pedobacter steynii]AOM79610.1 GNAT family N-acetyltransferase [Pedobacter steynii]